MNLQESQSSAQGPETSIASTAESQRVLSELRASNPLLTKEQEQAAMERLLNQGTQSVSLSRSVSLSHLCSARCISKPVLLDSFCSQITHSNRDK